MCISGLSCRRRVAGLVCMVLCLALTSVSPALARSSLDRSVTLTSAGDFVGTWKNENPDTDNITRFEIAQTGGADCDWGEAAGAYDSRNDALVVTWTFDFKGETQWLTLLAGGRLELMGHVAYSDGRDPRDYTEYFVRESSVPDYSGAWKNENPDTDNITHFEITQTGGVMHQVHMWGKCHPTDCDWGEAAGAYDSRNNAVVVSWTFDFKGETQWLTLLPGGRLELMGHVAYDDGRDPRDYTEYFVRESSVPDYSGAWKNENPDTDNITHFEITQTGGVAHQVHMWGKCHPTDCDWGEAAGAYDSRNDLLVVSWTFDFKGETQWLTLLPGDRLELMGHVAYDDGRDPRDYTEYFIRE
jgi:hypothetical protein